MGNKSQLKGQDVANLIIERLKANYREVLGKYWPLMAIFVLALSADGASTIYFMMSEGADMEFHPVIRLVSLWILGPVAGPVSAVIVKALVGILVAIYCKRFALSILSAASIVSFWAAWYNIWGWKMS